MKGLSGRQCAERIGGGVTRNAVLGKASRLGLPARFRPTGAVLLRGSRGKVTKEMKPYEPNHPWRMSGQRHCEQRGFLQTGRVEARDEDGDLNAITKCDPEPRERVALADLKACHCRWPLGDPKSPSFGFCGRPTVDGRYCAEHARRSRDGLTPEQAEEVGRDRCRD